MANIWQFRGGHQEESGKTLSKEVIEAAEGAPLLARLLVNRGIATPAAIRAFLGLEAYQPSSGWELPDMQLAVERIIKALDANEPILIYGDFDVDGITGTSILYETLKKHLGASVSFYIPDRATEGHGLNAPALIRLVSSRQVKLVITTDTGITNFSEVSLLNGLGVDTIVTDHHALPENLPPALANINSQRLAPEHPMHFLCGAGVAYKLCQLLLEARLPQTEAEPAAQALLDIVAVGTVVDMVPLVQENRYLVYRGLQVLNRRKRLGFSEILAQSGFKEDAPITSETLGFTIGPRLNALGRLERADQGVELITTDDAERARIIAAHLEFLNRKRRDLCDQTFLEAETHLQSTGGLADRRAVILASPDWNPGIIGIVASRLIEKYHVPTFMMVVDESKGEVRCSARSIPGFHLHDELLALQDYFLGFGGHAGAGGFALKLERLEAFKRDLHAICASKITDEQMRPIVDVDARLEWSQVNPHLITLVQKMAPFGMANPSPKFVLEDVNVAAQRWMGEGERHVKLVLTNSQTQRNSEANTPLEGIIWNYNSKERFDAKAPYGFVVVPELNTFNGATKVQLIIEDYNLAGAAKAATQVKTVTPAATAAVLSPSAPADEEAEAEGGPQWIDHRSREGVETFISQLLVPLQEKRRVRVYHEGRPPEIPFLDEALLCSRLQAEPADELILWDLPPSLEQLHRLLQGVQPEVIHLVGGKYQSIPVFQPEQNYLKLIMQMLRREAPEHELELDVFSARLATSPAVISWGLTLLERLGMLETRLPVPNNHQKLSVRLMPPEASTSENVAERLEYAAFVQALREVGQFRGWLLRSSLATIRTVLKSPLVTMAPEPASADSLAASHRPEPVVLS